MSYREELINSIEPNFIFSKKPLNRLKFDEIKNKNKSLNKIGCKANLRNNGQRRYDKSNFSV